MVFVSAFTFPHREKGEMSENKKKLNNVFNRGLKKSKHPQMQILPDISHQMKLLLIKRWQSDRSP